VNPTVLPAVDGFVGSEAIRRAGKGTGQNVRGRIGYAAADPLRSADEASAGPLKGLAKIIVRQSMCLPVFGRPLPSTHRHVA